MTQEFVENAITRAKCCLGDMHFKLAEKRAQGSKEADCLLKKTILLSMYIEALENVLDCSGVEANPDSNTGSRCNLNGLSGGLCYDDIADTLYIVNAYGGGTDVIPYQNYYFEYYTAPASIGPWTLIEGVNSWYGIIEEIDPSSLFLKIIMRCNAGDVLTREEIVEFRVYPPTYDAATFGYFTTTTDTTNSVVPTIWYIRENDNVTISNLNGDFIIAEAKNISTNTVLATNVQNFTVPVTGTFLDEDQITLKFQYIGENAPLPCYLYRLITIHIVPDPIIIPTNSALCAGGTVTLSANGTFEYDTYLWSTGELTSSIDVTAPGTYSCIVSKGDITNLIDYQVITLNPFSPTPIIVNNATGLEIVSPLYLCTGTTIDLITKDIDTFSAGYPATTTVDWIDISSGVPYNTTIPSTSGTTYQALVHLPGGIGGCTGLSPEYSIITLSATPTLTPSDVLCNGESTGQCVATFVDPPLPATVTITNVLFVWKNNVSATIRTTNSASLTDTITGLVANNYSVTCTVTYSNGLVCVGGATVFTIDEPDPIILSVVTQQDVTCNGNGDGLIQLTTSGTGTAPYTYFIDGLPIATDIAGSLNGGTYTISVVDDNGCSATAPDVTILEPAAITITASMTSCSTGANGVVTVTALAGGSGFVPNLEIYNASFVLVGTGDPGALPVVFSGLAPELHTIVAYDVNGCFGFQTVNVTPC